MTEKAKKYLVDILNAIVLIELFSEDVQHFFDYQKDLKTKSAIERQLGIIGEAVNRLNKVDVNIELAYQRQIVDFRNRLIHAYDNLDDAIVWVVLKKHIPALKEEAQRALENS